jgi:hypothetical protein
MLMPNHKGKFACQKDDFETDDLFAYMDHFGVEYDWMIKLSPRYNFNLFQFLSEATELILDEKYDELWEVVQSATLLFVNASGEDFEEFIEEAEVITGTESMIEQLERFLNDKRAD